MEIEILKKQIINTGYLDDPKIGRYLTKKEPEIVKYIYKITDDLNNSYWINKSLRARVIFLFKYNLDINKIYINNKWLTFERKLDDFLDKTGDYRKLSWKKSKATIPIESYTKAETISILKKDNYFLKFFGKGKNRTLLKENPKLYNSIYKHTSNIDFLNENYKKITNRILFLVKHNSDIEKIKCKKCKIKFTSFNKKIREFNDLCYDCFHYNNENKYPNKDWFLNKYGDNWIEIYNNFLIKNNDNFNKKSYSKISQKIFWLIYEKLNDNEKNNCYFKELNNEWFINKKENFFFVDFKINNKIIEFDGIYWHKHTYEKDIYRNEIYNQCGYDVLIISENDLIDKKYKIGDTLIDMCLKFIRNENK